MTLPPRAAARLLVAAVLLSLGPFVYLCWFTHPAADDFAYAQSVRDLGFWPSQVYRYHMTNGRYLATFLLSLSPLRVSDAFFYGLYPLIALAAVLGSCGILMGTFFRHTLSRTQVAVGSLVWCGVWLNSLPGLRDGLYWYAGIVNHTCAIPILALALAAFLRTRGVRAERVAYAFGNSRSETWLGVVLALAGAALAGLNESSLLVWDMALGAVLVAGLVALRRMDWAVAVAAAVSLTGTMIAVSSPGHTIRQAMFPEAAQAGRVLAVSGFGLLKSAARAPHIPALLIALVVGVTWRPGRVDPMWINRSTLRRLLVLLIGVSGLFFLPAGWGLGGLPPTRNLNLLEWMGMVLATPLLMGVLERYRAVSDRLRSLFAAPLASIALTAAIVTAYGVWGNVGRALADGAWQAPRQEAAHQARRAAIRDGAGRDLVVPARPDGLIFLFDDITADAADWKNTTVARYYGLRSIRTGADSPAASR